MTDEVISLRVGKELREKMRAHNQINWSAVARKALAEEAEKLHKIDRKKALEALADADRIRKSGVFDGGKTGTEIIREWRDKRK
ncbi:hypothetical protein COU60_04480 [Candidatus Pacearchaeota archaeon CG10_big_fil_rev_8_21_14_0_10_34_76]|nr:MAG: hypothetical protein COU60_04480 [Candidatus Pacearchaeota archaeon CG10_big_fil_rev_8_21_14_0_10_34_76]